VKAMKRDIWRRGEKACFPLISLADGMKVLDIGCGKGFDLGYISERYSVECYGVDIRRSVSNNNKKSKRVQFLLADLHNLPFKENCFDVVYSIGVIEHLLRIDIALNESLRVLRIGGQAFHAVPNMFSSHTFCRSVRKLLRKWNHRERSFTVPTLFNVFEKSGFTVTGYSIPYSNLHLDNLIGRIIKLWGFFIFMCGVKQSQANQIRRATIAQ